MGLSISPTPLSPEWCVRPSPKSGNPPVAISFDLFAVLHEDFFDLLFVGKVF